MTNLANTCWQGWVELSDEIDEDAIYAFRNGGCMALAVEVSNLTGLPIALICAGDEDDFDGCFDEYIEETFRHAVVMAGSTPIDIGGEADFGFNDVLIQHHDDYHIECLLVECPPQDPATVARFADLVIREYGLTRLPVSGMVSA